MRNDVYVDVDTQVDFCRPDGALFVPGSPVGAFQSLVAHAMRAAIPIVGSVDSHAYDAWEFASNDRVGPAGEDPRFPDHCVKGTAGWLKLEGTLPERFRFVPNVHDDAAARWADELIDGATEAIYFEKEVYSLFVNPQAEEVVRALDVGLGRPRFVVFGVATDYCVRAAALGLAERGIRCAVVTDAIAAIDEEGRAAAFAAFDGAGVERLTVADLTA